ncbi:MAG: FAD-dependent oxidoreductase [Erysipelotrichaceae bacterium]|nr:FAD-dependent oxidoreductase [Erysipelotrichaceae bacterium]
METKIAIIGGGLAGLHTAYELEQRGFKNIVIYEALKIGEGASGHNTGKVTIQQAGKYHCLNIEDAKTFYEAQVRALDKLTKIIQEHDISCGFQECLSALTSHSYSGLTQECTCYEDLGQSYTMDQSQDITLQIPSQYSYQPKKFLYGLSKILRYTQIIENCRILKITKNSDHYLLHSTHNEFTASHIIICTNYPIFPKTFSVYLHQIGQYMITTKQPHTSDRYTLSNDQPNLSYNASSIETRYTGFGARVGVYNDLKKLSQAFSDTFHTPIGTITYIQDTLTSDGLPIASPAHLYQNIYVVTGFNKWGNLNALVCAEVIGNLLTGQKDSVNKLLSYTRASLYNGTFWSENVRTISSLLQRTPSTCIYIDDVPYGEYTKNHTTYLVSLVCPHLKGILRFNPVSEQYECPVHGSVFNYDGKVLHSPAVQALSTPSQGSEFSSY